MEMSDCRFQIEHLSYSSRLYKYDIFMMNGIIKGVRIHHYEDYTQQDVTRTSAVETPLPEFPMQHDDLAYQKNK